MIRPAAAFPDSEHCPLGQLRLSWFVDLLDSRSDALELSLKLYHVGELQLVGYQQLITEAP